MKNPAVFILLLLLLVLHGTVVRAHCDTMDGPVVADAKKAIESNNVNYVLKWVHQENESELKEAFNLAMKVRTPGNDARVLADKYFFETLVRLHRLGEGMSYTGLKPSGTPINERIKAADRAIETGNLSELKKLVRHEDEAGLTERFSKVMALKKFDVNDVKAGREYVESYVQFFHFAEGEEMEHEKYEH